MRVWTWTWCPNGECFAPQWWCLLLCVLWRWTLTNFLVVGLECSCPGMCHLENLLSIFPHVHKKEGFSHYLPLLNLKWESPLLNQAFVLKDDKHMFSSESSLGFEEMWIKKGGFHYSAICSTLLSILFSCTNTAPPQVLQEQFGSFFFFLFLFPFG